MKIDINKVVDSRYRDFDIDPINEHQVERLTESMRTLGNFSALPARKLDDGTYEIAAGHHSLRAARKAGHTHVELVISDYDEDEMVRIMAIENLTQRGAESGAQMNAVTAAAARIAYKVLSDRVQPVDGSRNMDPSTSSEEGEKERKRILYSTRTYVMEHGPGERQLYRAINGFEKGTRAADRPEPEMITKSDLAKAIAALKQNGTMADIVTKVYAEVEEERKEDTAKAAEAQRKKEAKLQAEAEAERKRKADAEAKAKREAEEAERKEKEAKAKADRDAKAKAAYEKAKKEAEEKREAEVEARRKRKEAEDAERDRKAQAEADRKAKEDEAKRKALVEKEQLRQQQEKERIYDARCNGVIGDPALAETFRSDITTPGVMEVISRDQQLKVAKDMMEHFRRVAEGNTRRKAGSGDVHVYLDDLVMAIRKAEAAKDKAEREAEAKRAAEFEAMRLKRNQEARIQTLWSKIHRAVMEIEDALKELVKENKTWQGKNYGTFPVNVNMITTFMGFTKRIETLFAVLHPNFPGMAKLRDDAGNGNQKRLS